jgi:hypothetical protein
MISLFSSRRVTYVGPIRSNVLKIYSGSKEEEE